MIFFAVYSLNIHKQYTFNGIGFIGHYRPPEVNPRSPEPLVAKYLKQPPGVHFFNMYAPITDIISKYYLNLISAGIEGHKRSN